MRLTPLAICFKKSALYVYSCTYAINVTSHPTNQQLYVLIKYHTGYMFLERLNYSLKLVCEWFL